MKRTSSASQAVYRLMALESEAENWQEVLYWAERVLAADTEAIAFVEPGRLGAADAARNRWGDLARPRVRLQHDAATFD